MRIVKAYLSIQQILLRHQANLGSQLEICAMAKQHVSAQHGSLGVISSIVDATHQLVADLERIRAQFVGQRLSFKPARANL